MAGNACRASRFPWTTPRLINQLWKFAGQSQAHSGNDSIAVYQMMEELRMLTEYRRIRIMQSARGAACDSVGSADCRRNHYGAAACFFGVPSFRFHVLQVVVLSFLIALVLVAIADIDRPYQGDVTVQPEGFSFSPRDHYGQHPR